MQIGFIGAGKVGVSLGKYFREKGLEVGGYYSLSEESARWAAAFTETKQYQFRGNHEQLWHDIFYRAGRCDCRRLEGGKVLCLR